MDITFKQVLFGRNLNNEIYRCDIKRFFGWDLLEGRIEELHKVLMEISREIK